MGYNPETGQVNDSTEPTKVTKDEEKNIHKTKRTFGIQSY